jgi:hypothetical protein
MKDCHVSKMLIQNNNSDIQIFKHNNLNISQCQKVILESKENILDLL